MPFLLLVSYVALEIYVFFRVWDAFGFANTFFALALAAIIGIGLVKSQGRYLISKVQLAIARGQAPDTEVAQGLMVFIAGILFIIPGFISDVIALFLVIPGSRHLIAKLAREKFARSMAQKMQNPGSAGPFGGGSGFKVFTFGTGMNGSSWNINSQQRPRHSPEPQDEWARDVTPKVIDVTPISVKTSHDTSEND